MYKIKSRGLGDSIENLQSSQELKKQWTQYQTQREYHADVTKDVTPLTEYSHIKNKKWHIKNYKQVELLQ